MWIRKDLSGILAVVTVMDFANRFMNTTTGKVLVPPANEEEQETIMGSRNK